MCRHIAVRVVIQLLLSGLAVQSFLTPRPFVPCRTFCKTQTRIPLDSSDPGFVHTQQENGGYVSLSDEDYASFSSSLQELMNNTSGTDFIFDTVASAMPVGETIMDAAAIPPVVVEEKIEAPSVAKIFRFAIPAVGVWLCNPLLSLIDTSMVGLLSGTTEQAALNPAVAVTDYGALLIAFMYTATTNLVAASHNSDSDRSKSGNPRTTKTLIGSLQLSTYVGAGLGLVLLATSPLVLRAIIGNDDINPVVFASALKYVRIRALGMPAASFIGSAQAGCLGMQDIRSPLYVLGAAALLNLLGDLMFVGKSHPWIGGAAGAAWATVFSQYAAALFFVHWLCNKPKPLSLSRHIPLYWKEKLFDGKTASAPFRRLRSTVLSSSKKIFNDKKATNYETKETSARGCLEGRFRPRDMIKFPTWNTRNEFSPHVVSSTLGTTSMAAQQVILSLFYCLCPIADSLNLSAQSFVPALFGKKPSRQRSEALRQTSVTFVKAGALFGVIMAAVSMAVFRVFSRMFTADPSVIALINMVAPYLVGVFSVHGMVCATEGLLLGQKDLGFLGKMYASFFVAVPFFMLRVKKAALLGSRVDLTSVWKVFLGYQWFRFCAWLARVAMLQRQAAHQTNKE